MQESIEILITDEPLIQKRMIIIFRAKKSQINDFQFKLLPLNQSFKHVKNLKTCSISENIKILDMIFSLKEEDFPLNYKIGVFSISSDLELYKTKEKQMQFDDDFTIFLDFVFPLKDFKAINILPIENPELILKAIIGLICEKYLDFELIIYFLKIFHQTFPDEIEYSQESEEISNILQNFSDSYTQEDEKILSLYILFSAIYNKKSFMMNAKLSSPKKILANLSVNMKKIKKFLSLGYFRFDFYIAYAMYCCGEQKNSNDQIQQILSINNKNIKINCLKKLIEIYKTFDKNFLILLSAKSYHLF